MGPGCGMGVDQDGRKDNRRFFTEFLSFKIFSETSSLLLFGYTLFINGSGFPRWSGLWAMVLKALQMFYNHVIA